MPTRLIREGILDSDRVDALSSDAEVFYRRLMSKVDDHGLFDARLNILIASLYPLRRGMSESTCLQLLAECVDAKLVVVYQVGGKPYLQMLDTRWQTRSKPKFPLPEEAASVINCKQLLASVYLDVFGFVFGDVCVVGDGVENHAPPPAAPPQGSLPVDRENATTPVTRVNTPKTSRGSRLGVESLPDEWREFCRSDRPDLDADRTFAQFRNFWTAKTGQHATKLDWFATWRNWVMKEKPGPNPGRPNGNAPMSKQMQGIMALERMKHGQDPYDPAAAVVHGRDLDGTATVVRDEPAGLPLG